MRRDGKLAVILMRVVCAFQSIVLPRALSEVIFDPASNPRPAFMYLISSLKRLPFKEMYAIAKNDESGAQHLFVSPRSNNILT